MIKTITMHLTVEELAAMWESLNVRILDLKRINFMHATADAYGEPQDLSPYEGARNALNEAVNGAEPPTVRTGSQELRAVRDPTEWKP